LCFNRCVGALEAWAMNDEELAKQMSTYADAITAFAFVQGMAFGLVIGQGGELTTSLNCFWYFAVLILALINGAFVFMVRQCHSAEDRLVGVPATGSDKLAILSGVRKWRQLIILCVGIGEIILVLGVAFYPPRTPCPYQQLPRVTGWPECLSLAPNLSN